MPSSPETKTPTLTRRHLFMGALATTASVATFLFTDRLIFSPIYDTDSQIITLNNGQRIRVITRKGNPEIQQYAQERGITGTVYRVLIVNPNCNLTYNSDWRLDSRKNGINQTFIQTFFPQNHLSIFQVVPQQDDRTITLPFDPATQEPIPLNPQSLPISLQSI